ncbi:MAG: AMP-binding protein [Gammaproteobacteria bacterium]|nr:AMP-binding protein [Gammaproteobacteria bacterium]
MSTAGGDAAAGMSREAARAALTAPGQPYELETVEVRGAPVQCYRNAPSSLRELYAQSLAHEDRDFLVYLDERLTFAEVHGRAAALADRLLARSELEPGARVGIAMRNYPEWAVAYMAITAAGLVAVPMNAWWTREEMVYGLQDSGARLLIADQQRHDRIAPELDALDLDVLVARPDGELAARAEDLGSVIAEGLGAAMPEVAVAPDDDAIIMYTSGTTGFPKGAVSTHRAVVSSVLCFESTVAVAGLCNPEAAAAAADTLPAMLLTVPLFHVTGSNAIFLSSFRSGRRMVLMYKWDAEEALRLIEAERITAFTGVPTMTWEMLQSPNFDDYDTSSLTTVGGGGAPAPPEQVRQVEARFAGRPGIGYGLTETNAVGAQNSGDDYIQRPRSTGRPPLTVEIEAFDDDGVMRPRGVQGDLDPGSGGVPRLLEPSRSHGRGAGRRLVPERRHRPGRRGGIRLHRGPQEGDGPARWRERLLRRGGGGPLRTGGHLRGDRLRRSPRAPGRRGRGGDRHPTGSRSRPGPGPGGSRRAPGRVQGSGARGVPHRVPAAQRRRQVPQARGPVTGGGSARPWLIRRRWRRFLLSVLPALLTTVLLAGCGEGAGGGPSGESAEAAPGELVYRRYCYSCHASGAAGAPRTGIAEAWTDRRARGWDALMTSTLEGLRGMPARGLCRQCSDDDLALALGYMLQRSGGLPESAPAGLAERLEKPSVRD